MEYGDPLDTKAVGTEQVAVPLVASVTVFPPEHVTVVIPEPTILKVTVPVGLPVGAPAAVGTASTVAVIDPGLPDAVGGASLIFVFEAAWLTTSLNVPVDSA